MKLSSLVVFFATWSQLDYAAPQQSVLYDEPSILKQDWTSPPDSDESGHFIFNSLVSLLQHWPSTFWRNGHSVVLGHITPGTLLYHGSRTRLDGPPTEPEWASFDPEHSILFGLRLYTFAVGEEPLKILYFDGSSASKIDSGTIDTQEILLKGKLTRHGWEDTTERIRAFCDWGRPHDIKAFVRMEYDFEIMICNFRDGMQLVSSVDLVPHTLDGAPNKEDAASQCDDVLALPRERCDRDIPPLPPMHPNPPSRPRIPWPETPAGWKGSTRRTLSVIFEALQAGAWHDFSPGVTGVELDHSTLISFFDPKYQSLATARKHITNRHHYRAGNISETDVKAFWEDIGDVLGRPLGRGSGVRWSTIAKAVMDRYVGRLEFLEMLLAVTHIGPQMPEVDLPRRVYLVRNTLLTILAPYMANTSIPNTLTSEYLSPTVQRCAGVFTAQLRSVSMTPQEVTLKTSIEVVSKEICRSVGLMWLEAFEAESLPEEEQAELLNKWRDEVKRLMEWLGWSVFIKCRPACQTWEMCALPTWPMKWRGNEENYTPVCLSKLTNEIKWKQ